MKVKLLKEGYFHSVKDERKDKGSAEQVVSKIANNALIAPIKTCLERVFYCSPSKTWFSYLETARSVPGYGIDSISRNVTDYIGLHYIIIDQILIRTRNRPSYATRAGEVFSNWYYEYEKLNVLNIDYNKKKVNLEVECEISPESLGHGNAIFFNVPGLYLDSIAVYNLEQSDKLLNRVQHTIKKLCQMSDERSDNPIKSYLSDNNLLKTNIDVYNFLSDENTEFNVERIVLNLDKDVLLCPEAMRFADIDGGNMYTFMQDRPKRLYIYGEDEGYQNASKYLNDIIYRTNNEEDDISWEEFCENYSGIGDKIPVEGYKECASTLEECFSYFKSYDDVATALKDALKKFLVVKGSGHIYMSTGHFKKDYLIL